MTRVSVAFVLCGVTVPITTPLVAAQDRATRETVTSVAVLVFSNITGDAADGWMGVGIAETVASALDGIGGLMVIRTGPSETGTRTTTDAESPIAIAQALDARWVVSGAYQRLGDRMRITAGLTHVETTVVVQSAIVDGTVDEFFSLQDRLVTQIREGLESNRDGGQPVRVSRTEEWPFGPCPERGFRILTVESEINPMMVGGHAMSDSLVENCLEQPVPPGSTIRPMMHAHNPTVLENLVFVNWLGHGVRAIDISNPFNPREVGHARPVPWGDIMTYPEIHNGLIYVGDNHTGLHVFKYTGPRADEVPRDVGYSSNRTSPQRPGSPRDD